MSSINFKKAIYFNGYEFYNYNELAEFLAQHYKNAIKLVQDNTLFELIKEGDESLSKELFEATKDFSYCENILTYIIYRLSSNPRFITLNHQFNTTYEMALAIKRSYPNIDNDILTILKDKLLSKIYWNEYLFTKDPKHKRNHDFLVNVEENKEYVLSYYYFLILHLPENEKLNFVVNNVRFDSIDELISYLYTNKKYVRQIINEIKNNDYVLGLIASKSSLNAVVSSIASTNYLDFLNVINSINQHNDVTTYDFTLFLDNKMCVWLSRNYQNYSFESNKSKKLLREYSNVVKKDNMSFNEQFNVVKHLENLYLEFIKLYKSNKIVKRNTQITCLSDEYHLGYLYNEEIVCSKYLIDNDLIQTNITTKEYMLSEEKSIAVFELDQKSIELNKANDLLKSYYSLFDKERYNLIFFKTLNIFTILLVLISGYLYLYNNEFSFASQTEQVFVNLFGLPSLILALISLIFVLPEYNTLADINSRNKLYNSLNKKLNKTKLKITNLELSDEEEELVDSKVNFNFLNKYTKFSKKANSIYHKDKLIKEFDFDNFYKVIISISFLPLLVLSNYLIFNILGINLSYPLVSGFPVFYLINTFINIVLITKENFYRNTFIFYIASIILAVIINIL